MGASHILKNCNNWTSYIVHLSTSKSYISRLTFCIDVNFSNWHLRSFVEHLLNIFWHLLTSFFHLLRYFWHLQKCSSWQKDAIDAKHLASHIFGLTSMSKKWYLCKMSPSKKYILHDLIDKTQSKSREDGAQQNDVDWNRADYRYGNFY